MRVVKLSKTQNQVTWVNNPVFNSATILSDEENTKLLNRFLEDPTLQDEAVFANLHLVRHTVGRYLFHWPETRRFEDDMISTGMMALIQLLLKVKRHEIGYFRAKAVIHIKGEIEQFLNKNQSNVTASHMTNYRRLSQGKPIASKQDFPLSYEE